MSIKIKFSQIDEKINSSFGLYEIYTNDNIHLKVGISNNLKRRLKQHRNSRQNSLKIKNVDLPILPNNMESKQSILAKHLYFDKNITKKYNLINEEERQQFLENECYIVITETSSKEDARTIEIQKEKENFRYIGIVQIR